MEVAQRHRSDLECGAEVVLLRGDGVQNVGELFDVGDESVAVVGHETLDLPDGARQRRERLVEVVALLGHPGEAVGVVVRVAEHVGDLLDETFDDESGALHPSCVVGLQHLHLLDLAGGVRDVDGTAILDQRTLEHERSKKQAGYAIPLDAPKGIIPWVARTGELALVNDVSQAERYVDSPFPPKNVRSELSVPLLFDKQVIGVLDVQSDHLNAFTEEDRVIFEAVADNIASAIHNADLYSSEQWRRRIADSLREVAVLLSANVGVEEVLDVILTELHNTLPVDVSGRREPVTQAVGLALSDSVYPVDRRTVSVTVDTASGTADTGDYSPRTGVVVTFPAGTQTRPVSVPVRPGDALVLASALAWAAHVVAIGRLAGRHPTMLLSLSQMGWAASLHIVTTLAMGEGLRVTEAATEAWHLLVVTGDHGNDPSTPSTDHSREYVPLLLTGPRVRTGVDLGTRRTFADLGQTLAANFGVAPLAHGTSFLEDIVGDHP